MIGLCLESSQERYLDERWCDDNELYLLEYFINPCVLTQWTIGRPSTPPSSTVSPPPTLHTSNQQLLTISYKKLLGGQLRARRNKILLNPILSHMTIVIQTSGTDTPHKSSRAFIKQTEKYLIFVSIEKEFPGTFRQLANLKSAVKNVVTWL